MKTKKMTLPQVIWALDDAGFREDGVPVRFGLDAGLNGMMFKMYLADQPHDAIFSFGFEEDGLAVPTKERVLEIIADAVESVRKKHLNSPMAKI